MSRYLCSLAAAAVLLGAQVSAHHAVGALYEEHQMVRIEGELAQVTFRNPHSIVHLIVREKAGREVRYAVEWAGAGQLAGQGVTSTTLKIGDYLVITGSPSRNPHDRRLLMTALYRPKDRFTYQGGMEMSK